MLSHFQDTTVLVLGLGESGLAMARWCARFGARVRVWDSRLGSATPPAHVAALAAQVAGVDWVEGELTDTAFEGVRFVLKSPGLAPTDTRIAAPLQRAAERGVLVQGELDLFAHALAELRAERGYAPKVLAITGTNGKTTTTAMAAMLIERAGKRVAAAGNIGPTMLQTLADALDLEPAAAAMAAAVPHPNPPPEGEGAVRDDAAAAVPHPNPPPEGEGAVRDDALPAARSGDASPIEGSEGGEATPTPEDDDTPLILDAPPPPPPTFTHLPEVWVLELSSFQLDEAKGFEPSAATVLNLTQDHLDWHGSMAAYVAAKARVFGRHAVMVVNRDDPAVERLVPAPEHVKGVKGGRKAHTLQRQVVRFGLGAPQCPGDFGLVEANGMAWLVRARELDETLKPLRAKRGAGGTTNGATNGTTNGTTGGTTNGTTGGTAAAAPEAEPLLIQRLMPADALRVRGRHNATNALAALALATAIDCPLAPMLHGLREYSGEPHRVQYLATIDGIDAFDDSKGTNVGATVAALDGLGADKAPARLVVILGGDGKGQDFAPLAAPVARHARAVALIGRDAERIEQALAATGVPMQRFDALEAATRWCFERAHAGDAVLLSPACASLDMFRHYGHRAEVFTAEVHAIAADRGGVAA